MKTPNTSHIKHWKKYHLYRHLRKINKNKQILIFQLRVAVARASPNSPGQRQDPPWRGHQSIAGPRTPALRMGRGRKQESPKETRAEENLCRCGENMPTPHRQRPLWEFVFPHLHYNERTLNNAKLFEDLLFCA